MDLETLSFTSVVDGAITVLFQSERAFLNVSQTARQMQFVLVLKPPCYLGDLKRVQWTLKHIKVLQVSSSGCEFDRTGDFQMERALTEFNDEPTACLKLVSLEPSSANLKVSLNECKSNTFLVEFDFLLNYGSQAANSTVRSDTIHVGSKAKNVGSVVYSEFVNAKQRFAEALQDKVRSLQTQMAGAAPSALTTFVQTDILDANQRARLFTTDNAIVQSYVSKKRQRHADAADAGAAGRVSAEDQVEKLTSAVHALNKRVRFLEALVSEHKRLHPESQVAALAAATATVHQEQLEPIPIALPGLSASVSSSSTAPIPLQPLPPHLQAPPPLPDAAVPDATVAAAVAAALSGAV